MRRSHVSALTPQHVMIESRDGRTAANFTPLEFERLDPIWDLD